jgi:NADH dehydrogenase
MMRIALFGGTGFVGSYLVDALVAHDMQPVLLVRPGHESRVRHADRCEIVNGDVSDEAAIGAALEHADAAIYNIGILREFPSRGVTFRALQLDAARRVIDTAAGLGVRRLLLMSANGVDQEQTAYQATKRAAERHLAASGLDWTMFRPSVIFGDPRGRSEFATQLYQDVIAPPLPAPLFYPGLWPTAAGEFELSPVHVTDVAEAFVKALLWPTTIGQTLELGGPDTLSWRQILQTIADATGRRKLMLPVPAAGVSTAAALFDRFERFPVTRDQLQMLLSGNACSSAALARLGIEPTAFDKASLAYLNHDKQEKHAWHQNAA